MGGQVTISIWLFVFLLAVCAWAVLERVLIPSSRWLIRRRINRVIDEISARLDIQIKPFQLTKRQVLIDRLVYDPKIVEAIQETAQQRGAHVYVSPRNRVESILSALNMLQLRKLVRESGGLYSPVPEEMDVLAYYANAIAHWRQTSDDSINK